MWTPEEKLGSLSAKGLIGAGVGKNGKSLRARTPILLGGVGQQSPQSVLQGRDTTFKGGLWELGLRRSEAV